jgi:hypothetical protein
MNHEALAKLKDDLEAALEEDDACEGRFQALVPRSIIALDLDLDVVAKDFDLSQPSFERWIGGRSAPHPAIQPAVFRYFLNLVEAALKADPEPAVA